MDSALGRINLARDGGVLVLCTERFWPALGGVERYTLEIARALRYRWRIIVLTAVRGSESLKETLSERRGPAREYLVEPLHAEIWTMGLDQTGRLRFRLVALLEDLIHRVALRFYYRTRALALRETARLMASRLSQLDWPRLDSERVVLHAMGPWEVSLAGDILFPKAARVATPFIHPGHWGEDESSRNWFQRRDYLVALGEEDAKACVGSGVVPERVRRIPIPAPAPAAQTVSKSVRRVVLFLGVARKYKGVQIFVDAARRLRHEGGLRFVWAGPVPAESRATAAVAESCGVELIGPVSETGKRDLLEQALCLCLPSETEITPYSILEAWSAGASVITCDNAYMREFVGDAGLLVARESSAFADAIVQLKSRPELVRQHVSCGSQLIRSRHDPATIGALLDDLYRAADSERELRNSLPRLAE